MTAIYSILFILFLFVFVFITCLIGKKWFEKTSIGGFILCGLIFAVWIMVAVAIACWLAAKVW